MTTQQSIRWMVFSAQLQTDHLRHEYPRTGRRNYPVNIQSILAATALLLFPILSPKALRFHLLPASKMRSCKSLFMILRVRESLMLSAKTLALDITRRNGEEQITPATRFHRAF